MMEKLIFGMLRLYFQVVGRIVPRFVGKQAFDLFCTPRRPRRILSEQVQTLLDEADQLFVPFKDGQLAVYRWGSNQLDSQGTILLTHGWESQGSQLSEFVRPLLAKGYQVIAWDGPAHGASDGKRTTLPDFAQGLKLVVNAHGPIDAVIAHSFGAGCAALSVGGASLMGSADISIERLVLISGPNRFTDVFTEFGTMVGLPTRALAALFDEVKAYTGRSVDEYAVADSLCQASIPTLVVHDREDTRVPFHNAEDIVAQVPTATLLATEGLGHNRILKAPDIVSEVVTFLTDVAVPSHV